MKTKVNTEYDNGISNFLLKFKGFVLKENYYANVTTRTFTEMMESQ